MKKNKAICFVILILSSIFSNAQSEINDSSFTLLDTINATSYINEPSDSLYIGSLAPRLNLNEFLLGKPVKELKKGKTYVIEFWATWCGPCIEEMPRLSALSKKFKRKIIIIGVNAFERKPLFAIKSFVDSMKRWINYRIAVQDSNAMEKRWLDAAGQSTIPCSFIVNKNGEIAWIGYTAEIYEPLLKILKHDWDLQNAKIDRELSKRLIKPDVETFREASKFSDGRYITNFYGEPDSALLLINRVILKEPNLKYSYYIAFSTFQALLRKNTDDAYKYGLELMKLKVPVYDAIIGSIKTFPYQYHTLPSKIFELGAEACQRKIDMYPYTMKTSSNYLLTADWYLRAKNKRMAKKAMKNAIKAINSKGETITIRSL